MRLEIESEAQLIQRYKKNKNKKPRNFTCDDLAMLYVTYPNAYKNTHHQKGQDQNNLAH